MYKKRSFKLLENGIRAGSPPFVLKKKNEFAKNSSANPR